MLVIVFSATGHVDCAFACVAYEMRSDAAIAARSIVDMADKVRDDVETSRRRPSMTLLRIRDVVYQAVTRMTAVTVDVSVLPRLAFGSFPRDWRCRVRENSCSTGDRCCNMQPQ
jgi:hypothetical protein